MVLLQWRSNYPHGYNQIKVIAEDWLKPQVRKLTGWLSCVLMVAVLLAACSPADVQTTPTPTVTQTAEATPTVVWFPPTSTLIPQPTATPAPQEDLKPGIGALLFNDDFQDSSVWPRQTMPAGNIASANGKLTLSVQSARATLQATRAGTQLDNFYAEVTATVNFCQGDDMIGVLFRTGGENSHYRFLVDCQGRTALQVVIGGTPTFLQDWTASGELLSGLPQPFKIGIWANRDDLRLFINDQFQFKVSRGTYLSGSIGFYARAAGEPPLSVSFDPISVYALSPQPGQTATPGILSTSTPLSH